MMQEGKYESSSYMIQEGGQRIKAKDPIRLEGCLQNYRKTDEKLKITEKERKEIIQRTEISAEQ